ncbi:unnamed protein product, partial [Didymodactylos carnosus]
GMYTEDYFYSSFVDKPELNGEHFTDGWPHLKNFNDGVMDKFDLLLRQKLTNKLQCNEKIMLSVAREKYLKALEMGCLNDNIVLECKLKVTVDDKRKVMGGLCAMAFADRESVIKIAQNNHLYIIEQCGAPRIIHAPMTKDA